ncbi:Vibriobactin utilization protein ViuB [Marinomonas spartinae]|uniref:Vibriobactin utilization protein ViuB n=1 Tax=Marinomonas spartinae TaxID=1792290 RepID=A0A1A8TKL8_9GAMM|nr:siderophore-interacting protein [Marinomonas spartinae]SBS34092.1 Vibriobactin utilization protein ViuB [Marinomonas spartinae]SBS37796.1 Vibriobactin utilization protein ViuB [Marinomonas spartinae]
MSRPQPRELRVTRKTLITPNMLRVTLGGENIHTIPEDHESGYVKLIFPQGETKPLVRTYTIRQQRPTEIDIDFVLHEEAGPASTWARNVQYNETIMVGGPGPKKMITHTTDWQLLVGDMTALPAISVNLAKLPDNAKGYAVIEVASKEDIQALSHPTGVELKWVINPHPGQHSSTLLNAVKSLPWLEGIPSVWAACEFSSMKALRAFFKNDKAISKENLYISSYWKQGSNEDQHKIAKRDDAETAP